MLSVKLYTFGKKRNSTAIPGEFTAFNEYSGTLKEDTSLLSPRITFIIPSPFVYVTAFNYAYIESFKRYYYINNWTCEKGGRWIAEMSVDVLASWRDNIRESTYFLSRVATIPDETSFPVLSDSTYPTKANRAHYKTEGVSPFRTDHGGCYVVGIINGDTASFGGVSYYALSYKDFADLCKYLYGNPDWLNITDISAELTQALFSPMQYIVSVVHYPCPAADLFPDLDSNNDLKSNMPLGWWSIPDITYYPINQRVSTLTGSIKFTTHPQMFDIGNQYLQYPPYSEHVLEMPGFPPITLENSRIYKKSGDTTISYTIDIDIVTGNAYLKSDKFGGMYSGHVGVSVQLSQIRLEKPDPTNMLISAGVGLISEFGNIVNGDLASAATGILNCVEAGTSSASTTGSNGAIIDLYRTPTIYSSFMEIVPAEVETFGMPFCQIGKLANFPGFVQVRRATVDYPGLSVENAEIKNTLESGCFIE